MATFWEHPYREERPWGEFLEFIENTPSTVKILTVNPGESFSLQYHNHRTEIWYVLSGKGTIHIGPSDSPVAPHACHIIPPHTEHRVSAGEEAVRILEISIGDFDEKDIIRLQDRYGRTSS